MSESTAFSRDLHHLPGHDLQSTAWFPAALQGELTIAYQYTGFSKTVSGSFLSGCEAMFVAQIALERRRCEGILVGVCESLNSRFAHGSVTASGLMNVAEGCWFGFFTRDRREESLCAIEIAPVQTMETDFRVSFSAEVEKAENTLYPSIAPFHILEKFGTRAVSPFNEKIVVFHRRRGFEITVSN